MQKILIQLEIIWPSAHKNSIIHYLHLSSTAIACTELLCQICVEILWKEIISITRAQFTHDEKKRVFKTCFFSSWFLTVQKQTPYF